MLDVLRDAGVVDSGGKGLDVILESLVEVLTGHRRLEPPSVTLPHPTPAVETHTVTYGGPAYEVMYLIDTETDEVIESLRAKLAALCDSLVVVGGQGLFSVHVHVDDIGAANVTETFARHLMAAIHGWQSDGFDSVAREFIDRLPRLTGTGYQIADNGDLLIRRADRTGVERLALLPALRAPSWLDPNTGGPRL